MALTFDCAYKDVADYALPILRRYSFSAAVYVVTGQVAGAGGARQAQHSAALPSMSAEQIAHWAAQGIEFGAHSRTHRDLTAMAGGELEEEVRGSREDLARIIGRSVRSFVYPYGSYNHSVRDCVERWFDRALTCDEGGNGLHTDACLLRRTSVEPTDSVADFAGRLSFRYSLVKRALSLIRMCGRPRGVSKPLSSDPALERTRRVCGH